MRFSDLLNRLSEVQASGGLGSTALAHHLGQDPELQAAAALDQAQSGQLSFLEPGNALAAALATGRVRVQSQAVVSHVLVDPRTGRASGVEWVDGRDRGQRHVQRAALVVLCASTIESLRLLLHSQAVGGLEEVSGLLGQGLMDHISASSFFALPPQPAAGATELSGAGSCFIPNTVNLDGTQEAFLRGYGLWTALQRFDPPALLQRRRGEAVGFLIGHGEVLAAASNRVSLHPERRDRWGLPIAHIDCRWGANETDMLAHMHARMEAVVAAAGEVVTMSIHCITPRKIAEAVPIFSLSLHYLSSAEITQEMVQSLFPDHLLIRMAMVFLILWIIVLRWQILISRTVMPIV